MCISVPDNLEKNGPSFILPIGTGSFICVFTFNAHTYNIYSHRNTHLNILPFVLTIFFLFCVFLAYYFLIETHQVFSNLYFIFSPYNPVTEIFFYKYLKCAFYNLLVSPLLSFNEFGVDFILSPIILSSCWLDCYFLEGKLSWFISGSSMIGSRAAAGGEEVITEISHHPYEEPGRLI